MMLACMFVYILIFEILINDTSQKRREISHHNSMGKAV